MTGKGKIRMVFFAGVLVLLSLPEGAWSGDLISHWKFDEGSGGTAYDSAGGNHGTIYGAEWAAGQIGGALSFDGVDDYVYVGDVESLDFGTSSDFTINLWFKTSMTGAGMLINKRAKGQLSGYDIYLYKGKICVRLSDGPSTITAKSDGESFNNNLWRHAAAVFDRNEIITVYIDGEVKATSESISELGNTDTNQVFAVGDRSEPNAHVNFKGSIDNVMVLDRALFPEEVHQFYQNGLSGDGDVIGLEIIGPNEVMTNSSVQYTAAASYEDGSTRQVTIPAIWSVEPNMYARIDGNGLLTTGVLRATEDITVYAQYTKQEVTASAEMSVEILPPRMLYVPTEYGSIQMAIDDCNNGDVVIVGTGTYCENIDFNGKNIILTSTYPSSPTIVSQTIISAGGTIVSMKSDGRLSGFTICNSSTGFGDGVDCGRFSPTISHCVITVSGNGIKGYVSPKKPGSQPIIENNIIRSGYGVYLWHQAFAYGGVDAIIRNNVIEGTHPDSIGILYRASKSLPLVTGNIITDCERGINFTYDSLEAQRKKLIRYNNVWGNTINYVSQGNPFDLTDIQGNISQNPLLLNTGGGDYHLLGGSPCIDAGDPNYMTGLNETDLDGEPRVMGGRIDMGVDEFSYEWATAVALEIIGQAEVPEKFSSQYTTVASYGYGRTVDVTGSTTWSVEPPTYVSINENGVLRTEDIYQVEDATIYAQYSEDDIIFETEKKIRLLPPQTLYVPTEYGTIQAAIDATYDGDTVVVADGTYSGDGNRDIDFLGKAITVKSESGPENCIVDCNGTEAQPHRGFYLHRGEDSRSIVSGFTIKNGYATRGGAFYSHSCSPQIVDCVFRDSSADNYGGAIYIYSGNPLISGSTIRKNLIYGPDEKLYGGAIYGEYTSLSIKDSAINENSVIGGVVSAYWGNRIYGSAIATKSSEIDFEGCDINRNSARGRLDAKSNVSGTVFLKYCSASRIVDCEISHNKAIASRAIEGVGIAGTVGDDLLISDCSINANICKGMYVSGSGVFIMDVYPVKIEQSSICDNIADATDRTYGSGLCLLGEVNLFNCDISGNISKGKEANGGGIFVEGNRPQTFTNCKFARNSTTGDGGAIFLSAEHRPHDGNLLTLQNCTIADNIAGNYGGAIYYHSEYPENKRLNISNSIMWANVAQKGLDIYAHEPRHAYDPCLADYIDIIYSDMYQSELNICVEDSNYLKINWGEGNIDENPCFADPCKGDYHLLEDSPCIDAGDPNYMSEPNETDLDGNPRIVNDRIDMGAYEYTPPILAEINVKPKTLNLRSKGKWIMCLIRLAQDYNVADIEPNSILLEDEIEAERVWLGDEFAVAKFSRRAVKEVLGELETPAEVELVVSGELTDGTIFEGTDTIRVIDKGKGRNNSAGRAGRRVILKRKSTKD